MPTEDIKVIIRAYDATGQAFQGYQRNLNNFQSRTKDVLNSIRQNWLAYTAVLASSILAIKKLTSSFSDFEKNMAEVSTLVDTSKVSMKEFESQILAMAPKLGKAPAELAKGLYQVISAGVDAAQAISVLEVSTKAAVAGLTDTFTAVDIITTALNAYGLRASEAAKVSDILFTTVRLGKTTFGDLAASLGQVLPFTSQLNISLEEVSAAMSTLTAAGLSTEIATTALRALTVSFIQNAKEFEKSGVDIIKVIGDDGLMGAMKELKNITGGNIKQMQKFIPETRALAAGLNLAGEGALKFKTNLDEAQNSTGATNMAFGKMSATLDHLVKETMVNLDVLLIKMGSKSLPAVNVAVRGTTVLIKGLTDSFNDLIAMLGGAIAGFTALGIGRLPALFSAITPALIGLGAGIALTAPQIALLGAAMMGVYLAAIKAGEGIDMLVYRLTGIDLSGTNRIKEVMNDLKNLGVPAEVVDKIADKLEKLGFKGADAMAQFNMAVAEGLLIYDELQQKWVSPKSNITPKINMEQAKSDYKQLISIHAKAIDNMKSKSKELEKVEKDMRDTRKDFGDMILAVQQKDMGGWEKYYSTVDDLNNKHSMAMELSGDEKIKLLNEIAKGWVSNSDAIIENGEVVISAASAQYDALKNIKAIQSEVITEQEKKKASIESELKTWNAIEKQASESLKNIKNLIGEIPESKTSKIKINAASAIAKINEIKDKLDSIPDVTKKKVIVETFTKSSPIMPFSEGIDYMKEKINSLSSSVKAVFEFPALSEVMEKTKSAKYIHGGQSFMDLGKFAQIMQSMGVHNLGLNFAASKAYGKSSLISQPAWLWDRLLAGQLARANSSQVFNNTFNFTGSPRENALEVEKILTDRKNYGRSSLA